MKTKWNFHLRVEFKGSKPAKLHRGKVECRVVRTVFGRNGDKGGKSAEWFGFDTRREALAKAKQMRPGTEVDCCGTCKPMQGAA